MPGTATWKRVADELRRLGHAIGEAPPDDRILRTPDGDEWSETSLSRRQLDVMLRKGRVHRHPGET